MNWLVVYPKIHTSTASVGWSTQIKYLSKSTDTLINYYSIESIKHYFSILLEWKYKSIRLFLMYLGIKNKKYLSMNVYFVNFKLNTFIFNNVILYISYYPTAQNTWKRPVKTWNILKYHLRLLILLCKQVKKKKKHVK